MDLDGACPQDSKMSTRGRGRGRGRIWSTRSARPPVKGKGKGKPNQILATEVIPTPPPVHQAQGPAFAPDHPCYSFLESNSGTHSIGNAKCDPSILQPATATTKVAPRARNVKAKNGLGFPLTASSKSVSKSPFSSSKTPRSFNLAKTDPRLWVPVKFVKATALTDKSLLENPQQENLVTTLDVPKPVSLKSSPDVQKTRVSPLGPDSQLLAAPIENDPEQMMNFTEASIEHWQAQFPGLFNIASSVHAFSNHAPRLQSNHSCTPLTGHREHEHSKDFPSTVSLKNPQEKPATCLSPQPISSVLPSRSTHTNSHSPNVGPEGSPNDLALPVIGPSTTRDPSSDSDFTPSPPETPQTELHLTTALTKEHELSLPQESSHSPLNQVSTPMSSSAYDNLSASQIPQSDLRPPQSTDLSGTVFTVAKSSSSEALFYVDDDGDQGNVASFSSIHPTILGQVLIQDSNCQDDEISFQPSEFAPPDSKMDSPHLFRTITDEVNLQSPCKESFVANFKPSKSPVTRARKKSSRKQKRKERRKLARQGQSYIHRPDVESGSDIDWGDQIPQDPKLPSTLTKIDTPAISRKAQKRAMKKKEEEELIADYLKNTMMNEEDDSDEGVREAIDNDQSLIEKMQNDVFLKTFMRGMDPHESHQITIDELDQHAQEEKDDEFLDQGGWQSDSGASCLQIGLEALELEVSQSDEKNLESESSEEDCTLDQIYSELDEILSDNDSDNDSDFDLNPTSQRQNKSVPTLFKGLRSTAKPKGKKPDKITEDSSDVELLELLHMVAKSKSEDFQEELLTLTKDILALKKKWKSKGKKSGLPDQDNDSAPTRFNEKFRTDWIKAKKKREERRSRAEACLLNEPKTKKQQKKRLKREMKNGNNQEPDLVSIDKTIKDFISSRPDQNSLNLPPLTKKTRARVHQLATLYGMTSRSLGKGLNRFPVLHRTHRTSINLINKQKHQRIIYGTGQLNETKGKINEGKFFKEGPSKTMLTGKNREGDVVGGGVGHIGEENIGFKLLTKMGWSMGQTMGNPDNSASAIQVPLLAVMKSSKAGLGLSSQSQR